MSEHEVLVVACPKCGKKNEVLWVKGSSYFFRRSGTTGGSEAAYLRSGEKVSGHCGCGYVYRVGDLD